MGNGERERERENEQAIQNKLAKIRRGLLKSKRATCSEPSSNGAIEGNWRRVKTTSTMMTIMMMMMIRKEGEGLKLANSKLRQ